jgi:hypothetical protein
MVDHRAMKAYSEDLRQKVVQAVQQSATHRSPKPPVFSASASPRSSATPSSPPKESPLAQVREAEEPLSGADDDAQTPPPGGHTRTRPSATLKERRRFLMRFAGKNLSEPTLRRLLKRMGFCRKDGLWGRWNERSG